MKVNRAELVFKLREAINTISEKDDPSKALINMGIALAKIGRALKGVSRNKAKAAIETVYFMQQSGLMDCKDEEPETPNPQERSENGGKE